MLHLSQPPSKQFGKGPGVPLYPVLIILLDWTSTAPTLLNKTNYDQSTPSLHTITSLTNNMGYFHEILVP